MRQLSQTELHAIRIDAGKRGRYGLDKKNIKLAPIFRGEKRRHVVQEVMDVLRDWRLSPFEHESAVRHGLRQALCMDGHAWQRADWQAEEIVAEGLRLLGAKRPTWDEGQRHYVDAAENCNWCGVRIPDEDRLGKRQSRYCSDVCGRAALQHKDFEIRKGTNRTYEAARRIVARSRQTHRTCEQCGDQFQPIRDGSNQRFCSQVCKGKAFRTVPERGCRECGKRFRATGGAIYCSARCYSAGGRTVEYPKQCLWCGTAFVAESPAAAFCCKPHQQRLYRLPVQIANGTVREITPPVFDYVFDASEYRPDRTLTPARFDRFFCEAA